MATLPLEITKAKILVVDDQEPIRQLLRASLEPQGYSVRLAPDGQEGLKIFFAWQPSLVVLDVRMPKMDGWGLLDRIREVSEVPVIMLTALGMEDDAVRGLRGGADDYVIKPLRITEFLARVEAVLRKFKGAADTQEIYEDRVLHVDFLRHRVYLRGDEIDLAPQEFRLLAALVRNSGVVLSTDRLLDLSWTEGEGGPENVRVYIGYLRKKLEQEPREPKLIETVRSFGYRYRPPEG